MLTEFWWRITCYSPLLWLNDDTICSRRMTSSFICLAAFFHREDSGLCYLNCFTPYLLFYSICDSPLHTQWIIRRDGSLGEHLFCILPTAHTTSALTAGWLIWVGAVVIRISHHLALWCHPLSIHSPSKRKMKDMGKVGFLLRTSGWDISSQKQKTG